MVKITCVHTATGPAIFGTMENEIKMRVKVPCQISHMTNPGIITEVSAANEVTPAAAKELLQMYAAAAGSGADIILNMCSSVGEVAAAAAPLLKQAGVTMVRIDQRMCRTAAAAHSRIGVVATLRSTLNPSCRLVEECAAEAGKTVELKEFLAEGAFGLNQEQLTECLLRAVGEGAKEVDALIFAQSSMAACAEAVSEQLGIPVYTSPAYAAAEVAEAANGQE